MSWQIIPQTAGERAATMAQAQAIVNDAPIGVVPAANAGIGIYLGMAASCALVASGLTIVIKRRRSPTSSSRRTTMSSTSAPGVSR